MPAINRNTRLGFDSNVITRDMALAAILTRNRKSAKAASAAMGKHPNSAAQLIRVIEQKLKVKLFERSRGSGNSVWVAMDDARALSAFESLERIAS